MGYSVTNICFQLLYHIMFNFEWVAFYDCISEDASVFFYTKRVDKHLTSTLEFTTLFFVCRSPIWRKIAVWAYSSVNVPIDFFFFIAQ